MRQAAHMADQEANLIGSPTVAQQRETAQYRARGTFDGTSKHHFHTPRGGSAMKRRAVARACAGLAHAAGTKGHDYGRAAWAVNMPFPPDLRGLMPLCDRHMPRQREMTRGGCGHAWQPRACGSRVEPTTSPGESLGAFDDPVGPVAEAEVIEARSSDLSVTTSTACTFAGAPGAPPSSEEYAGAHPDTAGAAARARATRLRRLAVDLGGDPATTGHDQVRAWLDGLDCSPEARRKYRHAARAFFGWAQQAGLRADNPVLAPVRASVDERWRDALGQFARAQQGAGIADATPQTWSTSPGAMVQLATLRAPAPRGETTSGGEL